METIFVFFAYIGFLLLTLFLHGRTMTGPWFFLLRSFFPNWRFYHRVGPLPVLYVRASSREGVWQDWRLVMPRARRRVSDLFHNPKNNLALANQSLVEHLWSDIKAAENGRAVMGFVSYRLVVLLALEAARLESGAGVCCQYQFEIRLLPAYGNEVAAATVLTSPVLEA